MTNHVGTVGIVMPMYNARQTVLRAVQSVMNQTWPDWHLYLINDKSTDDSLALVREHCNDPRITILDNEVNLGAAETRNVGLRAAKEEIIAFLDSDDEWHVDKLAQQAAAIAAGDDFVITEYHYKTKNADHDITYSKPFLQQESFVKKQYRVCFSSVCFRRPPQGIFFQRVDGDVMRFAQTLGHKVTDVLSAGVRIGIFDHQDDFFHLTLPTSKE